MRILVIESDAVLANGMQLMLESEDHAVDSATTGAHGIALHTLKQYDAVASAFGMPDLPGTELLKELKKARPAVPVLVLMNSPAVRDKVNALKAGGDSYLEKPFHKDELLAWVWALVCRSRGYAGPVLDLGGGLVVDCIKKKVEINGVPVWFTRGEYRILELMALRAGRTLSSEFLVEQATKKGKHGSGSKLADVYICKIRKKLSDASGGKNYISTTWGQGYEFLAPQEQAA